MTDPSIWHPLTVFFLVAGTQLYKRLCPSVGPSVRWTVMIELESVKTRISAPAMPTRPQLVSAVYPAVFLFFTLLLYFVGLTCTNALAQAQKALHTRTFVNQTTNTNHWIQELL